MAKKAAAVKKATVKRARPGVKRGSKRPVGHYPWEAQLAKAARVLRRKLAVARKAFDKVAANVEADATSEIDASEAEKARLVRAHKASKVARGRLDQASVALAGALKGAGYAK